MNCSTPAPGWRGATTRVHQHSISPLALKSALPSGDDGRKGHFRVHQREVGSNIYHERGESSLTSRTCQARRGKQNVTHCRSRQKYLSVVSETCAWGSAQVGSTPLAAMSSAPQQQSFSRHPSKGLCQLFPVPACSLPCQHRWLQHRQRKQHHRTFRSG